MLARQTSLVLSPYSKIFDVVVSANHRLRLLKSQIDFSFIRKEVKDNYCLDNGRNAEDPVRMFKYLFLKCMYDLSDRGLMDRARTDMAFKFFLDIAPEADVIDPSLLSKFRRKRLKDMKLMDFLIAKSIKMAVDLGLMKSRTLIIDATHTCSQYNPYAPLDLLRLRSKQLRHAIYNFTVEPETYKKMFPKKNTSRDINLEIAYSRALITCIRENEIMSDNPHVAEKVDLLEETISDIEDHFTASATDEDARVGHKTADSSFFGYKTSIMMTSDRLITAAVVTPGDKPDGKELPNLVEKSLKNLGASEQDKKIDYILGDGAYGGDENLKFAKSKGLKLVSRPNSMLYKSKEFKDDGFELNKDAGMYTCPAGHLAIEKRILKYKDRSKGNDRIQFKFDPEKCSCCKLRDKCLSQGAKARYYSISIRTPEQEEQMKFCETEEFKEKYKPRYMIEAKNSELKNIYGYDKALSFGIHSMEIQGAMIIFVSNIQRILRLMK